MTQNDNADFIAQINDLTEQMVEERDGLGRVISRSNDWMENAETARQCLHAMTAVRNELFGLMTDLVTPLQLSPPLPNYNQFPEPNQEIEQEEFDVPKRLLGVAQDLIRAKREQAA